MQNRRRTTRSTFRTAAATAFAAILVLSCVAPASKGVLGAVAAVQVHEADLTFRARIDTGAEVSSIHATRLELIRELPTTQPRVRFDLANERGERRSLELPLVDVAEVRNAQGSEQRYRVALTLTIGEVTETVTVTLRDRATMTHKLLVGRDVLSGRFLVDVDAP